MGGGRVRQRQQKEIFHPNPMPQKQAIKIKTKTKSSDIYWCLQSRRRTAGAAASSGASPLQPVTCGRAKHIHTDQSKGFLMGF